MDLNKIVIVAGMIYILLFVLLIVKLLQKQTLTLSKSDKLQLICSLILSKETSAHVIRYADCEYLISASKNGSAAVTKVSKDNLNDWETEI